MFIFGIFLINNNNSQFDFEINKPYMSGPSCQACPNNCFENKLCGKLSYLLLKLEYIFGLIFNLIKIVAALNALIQVF